MAIDNPQAIRYVNEVVRPLSEKIRALKAEIDASRVAYDGGIGDYFWNHGAEAVEDGREAEGVSRLTGNDVLAWNSLVNYDLKAVLDAVGTPATVQSVGGNVTIAKPCVRALEAR